MEQPHGSGLDMMEKVLGHVTQELDYLVKCISKSENRFVCRHMVQ